MASLQTQIRRRARYRCEYCQLPQFASRLRHQTDHIISARANRESYENLPGDFLRFVGWKLPISLS